MSADEFFSMELPDIQGLIKDLNLLDENVNKAVRNGLHKGADIILAEQKRLAPDKLDLAKHISKGNVYVTKNGVLGVAVGYLSDAFVPDENNINHGVIGSMYEFGRPGQTPERSDKEMEQKRKRIPNKKSAKRKDWKKAVPTRVKINKGTIQAQPHIRRGFDNVVEQAAQAVIDAISSEIDKLGD